ncbi:MAG: amino acid ABC transporter ATP-binding protein [Lachnospiraceae bacterium]|nr:amino acid ABC transporter ATP-binding protein [Lachnospiraceae bacterium]
MIQVKNLKKQFGKEFPLKDINFTVEEGDVISIIGPSGTGKSTLLRCMNRLETSDGGQIIFHDKDICDPATDLNQLRRKMGMVFQSFYLFPHMTVLENIVTPQTDILNISREEACDVAMKELENVGLAGKALNYPKELSGGQKQRVAIARALAMKPEVMLFDEPTSALDPTMVSEVLAVIRNLARSGLTMLIVTHEMRLAREVSSKVLYIDEGIVFEEGSPEKIFDNPEKKKTRDFIYRISVWNWDSTVRDMDTFKLLSSLEAFCQKQFMDESHFKSCRLLIEEFVSGFVNRKYPDDRVKIAMNLGENDDPMSVEIDISELTGKEKIVNALKKPDKNDLSAKIISSKLYGVPEVNDSKIIWELK